MALIICKTCGNKISDTADACIHCGEPIQHDENLPSTSVPEVKIVEAENTNTKPEARMSVNFNSLGKVQQEELVHAFWDADKTAMSYQRKKLLLDYLKGGFIFLILPPTLAIIFMLIFHFKAQSPDLLIFVLASGPIGYLVYGLQTLIIKIIEKSTINKRIKRLTYEKRFQVWVRNEKQITYNPVFTGKYDQEIFEQIDIETYKL